MSKKMWFGIPGRKLKFVPEPLISSTLNLSGYSETVSFQNGGSDLRSSAAKHRVYDLGFSDVVAGEGALRELDKFSSGYYGEGFIYLTDPYTFETNVLPAHWATPSLMRSGWPKISAASVSYLQTEDNDYDQPLETVLFSFDSETFGEIGSPYRATILIPPTHTLHLGASGYTTGSGLVAYGVDIDPKQNLVTNPSFETATDSPLVSRKNLMEFPSMELSSNGVPDGWVATANADIYHDGSEKFVGAYSARVEATVADAGIENGDVVIVEPSESYMVSAYVKGENGKEFRIEVSEYDSGDGLIGTTVGGAVVADNSWQRVNVARVFGSTGVGLRVRVVNVETGVHEMFVDAVLVEQTNLLGDYFDGSFTESDELNYRWTSVENESISEEFIAVPKPSSGGTNVFGNSFVIRSDQWFTPSGAHSARIIPSTSNNDSYYAPGGSDGGFRLGLQAGKTYVAIATCRLSEAQTGSLNANARKIVALVEEANSSVSQFVSDAASNGDGVTQLRVEFTVPEDATGAFVRLYNGASVGNGDVWWDDFAIVEAPYVGEYFDGFNGMASFWDGAVNDSTSTTTVEYVKLDLLDTAEPVRMNATVDGSDNGYVHVYISQDSETLTGEVVLCSMMGQIYPSNVNPQLNGVHVFGEGHTGLKFVGEARSESYVYSSPARKLTNYVLQEVEAWR